MKFRTLLLGSATALIAAGGAQAADLRVAEPVDYLQACTNYGAGYYKLQNGCILIGGYVRFDVEATDAPAGNGGITATTDKHRFRTQAQLTATYKQATTYGTLTAFAAFLADASGSQFGSAGTTSAGAAVVPTNGDPDAAFGTGRYVKMDEAYINLANWTVGHTGSTFDALGTYTIQSPYGRNTEGNTDLIRYEIPLSGIRLAFAAEDYRDRGDRLPGSGLVNAPTGRFPDLVASAQASFGIATIKVAFGYGDRVTRDAWGVQGTLALDLSSIFAKGDAFSVYASYSGVDGEYVGDPNRTAAGLGRYWGLAASARHYWVENYFYTALSAGYISTPGTGATAATGLDPWNVAFRATVTPVPSLNLSLEGRYFRNAATSFFNPAGTWVGLFRAQKDLN